MTTIRQHLELTYKISKDCQKHFVEKNQDELIRFIFCGIQKVQKISKAFISLYHHIEEREDEEIEFSLGILARTLLMDMILFLKIHNLRLTQKNDKKNMESEIRNFCYAVVIDGAWHYIKEIHYDDSINSDQKNKLYDKINNLFPQAFDFSKNKPEIIIKTNVSLQGILKSCNKKELILKKDIEILYSFYSKYDHLNHFSSSIPSNLSFKKRKENLDFTIEMALVHLKDLLSLIKEFDIEYYVLSDYINEINMTLNESYKY